MLRALIDINNFPGSLQIILTISDISSFRKYPIYVVLNNNLYKCSVIIFTLWRGGKHIMLLHHHISILQWNICEELSQCIARESKYPISVPTFWTFLTMVPLFNWNGLSSYSHLNISVSHLPGTVVTGRTLYRMFN